MNNNYVRPEIAIDGAIDIRGGRHPVVELMLSDEVFVPNDVYLDTKSNRMSIITGPNMSGKSTYMRQAALITLMAQIGSFVPASYAKISVVDRIFTRVGASDDLTAGQSTFMYCAVGCGAYMRFKKAWLQNSFRNALSRAYRA